MLGRLPFLTRNFADFKLVMLNLPWTVTKDEVARTVKALIQFERLDLPASKIGRNGGFAFLTFATEEEKQKATAALSTLEFGGRKIIVREPSERPKSKQEGSQRKPPSGASKQN